MTEEVLKGQVHILLEQVHQQARTVEQVYASMRRLALFLGFCSMVVGASAAVIFYLMVRH